VSRRALGKTLGIKGDPYIEMAAAGVVRLNVACFMA